MKPAVLLLAASVLSAQVTIRLTPEPMLVPVAAVPNARDLGRWIVEGCNFGALPVSLPWEQVSMAAPPSLRLIDTEDAALVLQSRQKRSMPAVIVTVAGIGAQAAAIGLGLASKANAQWAAGLSIGSTVLPAIGTVAQGQVPSISPLLSTLKYPVYLPPGGCFTDHRFAAKVTNPQVMVFQIPPRVN